MWRALIYALLALAAFAANSAIGGVLQSDLLLKDGRGIFETIAFGLIAFAGFQVLLRVRRLPPTPLTLDISFLLALAYGAFGSSLYQGAPPYIVGTIFKASSIVVLALIAWTTGGNKLERAAPAAHAARSAALLPANKLLTAGLLFGAAGDALLAWSPNTFLYGAFAFLIGHLFYITLWLRAGDGITAALKSPPRLIAALALIAACIVMTYLLVPRDNAMFAPLAVYTGVLTLMALCSFTLPATRWLVMAGAVLFFISDGFVAWNMFHHDPDPTLAYWRSFAGWMIYWAAQAAICFGALGLHKTQPK